MIHHIVQFALRQRFLIIIITLLIVIGILMLRPQGLFALKVRR